MRDTAKTIAIIGTAGRKADAEKLSRELYDAMYERALETCRDWQILSAVSGGAAYADHLAVRAFLEGHLEHLQLHLPAEFRDGRFIPDSSVKFNPGRTMNHYHNAFSQTCGLDSLNELDRAIIAGAQVVIEPGFHNRNNGVARKATHLVAFTFGPAKREEKSDVRQGDKGFPNSSHAGLKEGGTAHTWRNAQGVHSKRHYNLTVMHRHLQTALEDERSSQPSLFPGLD